MNLLTNIQRVFKELKLNATVSQSDLELNDELIVIDHNLFVGKTGDQYQLHASMHTPDTYEDQGYTDYMLLAESTSFEAIMQELLAAMLNKAFDALEHEDLFAEGEE